MHWQHVSVNWCRWSCMFGCLLHKNSFLQEWMGRSPSGSQISFDVVKSSWSPFRSVFEKICVFNPHFLVWEELLTRRWGTFSNCKIQFGSVLWYPVASTQWNSIRHHKLTQNSRVLQPRDSGPWWKVDLGLKNTAIKDPENTWPFRMKSDANVYGLKWNYFYFPSQKYWEKM